MGYKVTIEFEDKNEAEYFTRFLESLYYGGECDNFPTVADIAMQIKEQTDK